MNEKPTYVQDEIRLCKFVPAHAEGTEWVPDAWVPTTINDAMIDAGWRELAGASRLPLTQRDQEQFQRALRAALGLDPWGDS